MTDDNHAAPKKQWDDLTPPEQALRGFEAGAKAAQERDRLKTINAELVKALERLEKAQHPFTKQPGESRMETSIRWGAERENACEAARAALAKARL